MYPLNRGIIVLETRTRIMPMTAPALNRLLISHITLRGPELSALYHHIATHPGTSYDNLVACFVPVRPAPSELDLAEAPLRETLNFLLVACLVEQQGNSRFKARFAATPLLAATSFPMLLLHHIRNHPDERQQAPALIYRQLVLGDVLTMTAATLRDQMERGEHCSLFAWTGEKIGFWLHLYHAMGVIRRLKDSSEMLVVPQPALVLAMLTWVQQQQSLTSLAACLHTIEATFLACFTARGRVHCGLAQTLLALDALGHIRLTHLADAAHSLLLGERRVSDVVLVSGSGSEREAIGRNKQGNNGSCS